MPTSIKSKRRQSVTRWTALLHLRLPSLSGTQAAGLALWSIGIILAQSASLHAITLALACWVPFNPFSLRKRLQEWYLEATAKKGHGTGGKGFQRRDFDPYTVSADLLRWILDDWPNRQLVLALDPTNFGDRFTVLNISVLYRGCAVPVIWTVLKGGEAEAWEPHWERMLQILAGSVPAGWQVLVLTDRGMYSPSLFRCLVRLHWHPFLRIRAQGFYRPQGGDKWLELNDLRPKMGQAHAFAAEVFKNEAGQLQCTLATYQGEGHEEPWLIVTDVGPGLAQAIWYGLRAWIEQGYKRVKREGWDLQRTRILEPKRLERLWLAVAVATMWVLEVGGDEEVAEQKHREKTNGSRKKVGEDTPAVPNREPEAAVPNREPEDAGSQPAEAKGAREQERTAKPRIWAVFARGWNLLRNALPLGVLLLGSWYPEAWPNPPRGGLQQTPAACPHGAEQATTDQPQGSSTVSSDHNADSS